MGGLKTTSDASISEMMGAQSDCPFNKVKHSYSTNKPSTSAIEKA